MDFSHLGEYMAVLKGCVAGFFFLLFTHKPHGPKEQRNFAFRVGAGLSMAVIGTELAQYFYKEIPPAPTAAVLMAFGLEIAKKKIGALEKKEEE